MPRTTEHKAGSHTSGMARAPTATSEYEKAAELFAREQVEMETVENFDDGSEVVVSVSVDVKRLSKQHKDQIAVKQQERKRKVDEANVENALSPIKKRNYPLTTVGRMDGAYAVRFHDLVVVKDETGKIFNKPLSSRDLFPSIKITSSQAPVDAGSVGSVVPRPTPIDIQVFEPPSNYYEDTWSTVENGKSAAASRPGSPEKPIVVKDDIKPLENPWCSDCRTDAASDCPSGRQCGGCGGDLHEKTLQDIYEEDHVSDFHDLVVVKDETGKIFNKPLEEDHVSESEDEEEDDSTWDNCVERTNALHNTLTEVRMSLDDVLGMVPPRLVRDYTKEFLQQRHRKTAEALFDIANEVLTAMGTAEKILNKALDIYEGAWAEIEARESADE